jgi:hypothetical protein
MKPNQGTNPKSKREEELKVIWEYEPTPDAEDRLLRAYEMIFEDILSEEFTDPSEDPKPGDQQRLF